MKIKMGLLVGFSWLLAGCVDVTATTAADGGTIYTIDCDVESQRCFDKAADLCPAGYYLVERRSGSKEMRHTQGIIASPYTVIVIACSASS